MKLALAEESISAIHQDAPGRLRKVLSSMPVSGLPTSVLYALNHAYEGMADFRRSCRAIDRSRFD